ncbi:MAG: IclR family transcriptional regulator [Hyphomicrobiales bacterium]|nr:IclR family transcriptional regulator [Hyphomicrobiales bacterium]
MPRRVDAEKSAPSEPYHVEGVARAAQLITAIAEAGPKSPRELSRRTGLSNAMVEQLTAVLEQHGLVTGLENGFELGVNWLALAQTRERGLDLRRFASPIMRRIRDQLNETVILAVRSGNRRINIDYVESTHFIRRVTQPGFEVPLHIGATGRVLLSGLSEDELSIYLSSADLADGLTSDRLREECRLARLTRSAVARREITSDTAAASASIFDHHGHVVAALTITCPEDRFTPALEADGIRSLTEGARRISALLGHQESERPLP